MKHAIYGILSFFRFEANAYTHLLAAVLAMLLGYTLQLSAREWLLLILAICLVFIAEMLNTAVELLCNLYQREENEKIRHIKDISAGAVLFAVIFALITGGILFIPKLL